MDWQLEENIRQGRTCDVCVYGAHLAGHPDINLCNWSMWHEGEHLPGEGPRVKTCRKFVDATAPEFDYDEWLLTVT